MELTLPSSKTAPLQKGVKLTIAASFDIACQVHEMERFQIHETHRPQYATLFCLGILEQQAFTREDVVHMLQELATAAGLGHGV